MGAFRLGSIQVDPSRNIIANGAGSWSLEPKIMDLLALLAVHPGEVLSREALIDQVWKVEYGADESLTRAVSLLRKAFRDAGHAGELIETIPKRGYRLTVTFDPETASPVASGAPPARPPQPEAAPAPPPPSQLAQKSIAPEPSKERSKLRQSRMAMLAVAASVVVALILGAWAVTGLLSQPAPTAEPRLMTVAVLPFKNLSAQADDKLLATGIARGMRNSLSEMAGLRVLSDASTFAAAETGASAQDMGKTLSADWLLDGGFTRTGDTIELTADLVDTSNGANFWTGRESGPASDMGRIQQILLSRVVEAMLPRVDRGAPLPAPKSQDPRIYPLVREAYELTNVDGLPSDQTERLRRGDKAWGLIQQALAIDPENSDALVTLAVMTANARTTELFNAHEPNLQRQMRAAEITRRALASNPNNIEAMAILAEHYRRHEWRWADAAALFEKALQLNQNHLYLRQYYSYFFLTTGNCVASLEQTQVAVNLAPNLIGPKRVMTRPLRCLGRYKESQDILMSVLQEQPANLSVMSEAYLALLLIRDAGEMRKMADKVDGEFFKGAPPPAVATLLARMRLAADMLEGRRKQEFVTLLRGELDQMMGPEAPSLVINRLGNDALWILAIELAWAGDAENAARALAASMASGSLYISETLPYGASEFPEEVRAMPAYRRAWTEDLRLVELTRIRKENLDKRLMLGRTADGTIVTPKS